METTSQPKPLWPIVLGGVVLLLLFIIVTKLLTVVAPATNAEDAERIAERTKAHEELVAEDKVKLETYAWVDKAKGTVQIPINEAMTLTMAKLNQNPPAAAGPINPPAAPEAAAPAPTDAAAPAPAATEAAPATTPATEATPAAQPTPAQ